LRPDEVVLWITERAESKLAKTEAEARRRLQSLQQAAKALAQMAGELQSKSEKDMQTKRGDKNAFKAAKAVKHLADDIVERLEDTASEEEKTQPDYRQIEFTLSRSEKTHRDILQSKTKWSREIQPFYILDMMGLGNSIDKLRRLQGELAIFLNGQGQQLRDIETIEEKARELVDNLAKISDVHSRTESLKESTRKIDAKLNEHEQRYKEITEKPMIRKVAELQQELHEVRTEIVEKAFRRLGRPLRKLETGAGRGNIPMASELRESLASYLKAPSRTLLDEDDDYPKLRQLLKILIGAASDRKISLKKAEQKKLQERYQTVVEQSGIRSLQAKGRTIRAELESATKDHEVAAMAEELDMIRKTTHALRKERGTLERTLDLKASEKKDLEEHVMVLKRELEGLIKKLTGSQVEIEISSARP
jgi:DNA repair exonuclease SbcCD ATPase subunit